MLFAELFDRHFDPTRSYLARRVGGQLADDLAAEVFLQAFKARFRYDTTELKARPWLYGIASRLLSHHYRDVHRRLLAYARAASDGTVTDSTDEVDARTDAAAAAPRITEALAALAPGDRDALLLFVWGSLTYDEIGRALGIPTGTVRSRIHRARRIVRELIGPMGQYQVRATTSSPDPKGQVTVDDLQEIQRLFKFESEISPRARDRARERLMQAIAAEQPGPSTMATMRRRRRRVPALALVATIAALAFVAPSLVSSSDSGASAADVLRQLAGRAQGGWESPRAGQFIYTKTVGRRWDCRGGSCSIVDFERESWVAFDGSGRVREEVGGTGSDKTYHSGALGFNELTGTLGEDRPRLRRYVESVMPAGVEPTDFALFVTISDLLGETQALPEARAALFRLAATLPGARSLGTITDATGRPGVGVEYSDGAVSRQIVFNSGSALVLGVLNVAPDGSGTRPPTRSEVALGVVPGTYQTYVDSGLVTSTEDRRPRIG